MTAKMVRANNTPGAAPPLPADLPYSAGVVRREGEGASQARTGKWPSLTNDHLRRREAGTRQGRREADDDDDPARDLCFSVPCARRRRRRQEAPTTTTWGLCLGSAAGRKNTGVGRGGGGCVEGSDLLRVRAGEEGHSPHLPSVDTAERGGVEDPLPKRQTLERRTLVASRDALFHALTSGASRHCLVPPLLRRER